MAKQLVAEIPAKKKVRQRASDHSDPSFSTTLERGLMVLSAFQPDDPWLSNAELAQRTQLPRPSVSRLTNTLIQLGYLCRNSAGHYRVGSRVLSMAYPLLARFKIRQIARPLMRDFVQQIGGTVSIGIQDGADAILLEVTRANELMPYVPEIGFSIPLHTTAMGQAVMSLMSESELEAVDAVIQMKEPEIAEAERNQAKLGIAAIREEGFCVVARTWRPETLAVATPLIRTRDGDCLGLVCAIPSFRMSPSQAHDEVGPRLVALAGTMRTMMDREHLDGPKRENQ